MALLPPIPVNLTNNNNDKADNQDEDDQSGHEAHGILVLHPLPEVSLGRCGKLDACIILGLIAGAYLCAFPFPEPAFVYGYRYSVWFQTHL
jgi:hypothetical protein